MSSGAEERVVDSRGRRCPLPVIDLARAMPDVPVGGIVVVLSDDPAAATDLPAWCRMRGQDYLGAEPCPGTGGEEIAATAHRIRRVG